MKRKVVVSVKKAFFDFLGESDKPCTTVQEVKEDFAEIWSVSKTPHRISTLFTIDLKVYLIAVDA